MEINALDSLAPRKQLSLYVVHRVSRDRWHLAHNNCLSQIQALILGVRRQRGQGHLETVYRWIQHDNQLQHKKFLRTFTSNRILANHYARFGSSKGGRRNDCGFPPAGRSRGMLYCGQAKEVFLEDTTVSLINES